IEHGEAPEIAAEKGGREVALPVLADTLSTIVVFFPVVFLYGVSRYLFTALALAVALAMLASYFVAMTVMPLFCAKFIRRRVAAHELGFEGAKPEDHQGFNGWFNRRFEQMLDLYEHLLSKTLVRPLVTVLVILGGFLVSLSLFPQLGVAYFPRTDPGQFVVNLKAPTGTHIDGTEKAVEHVERIIREVVAPEDLRMVVANIGITTDFSALYTPNAGPHTAFVQVSLNEHHRVDSYEYMRRVRERLRREMPHVSAYFQSGGLVDAVLNLGLPAPIDIQVSGSNLEAAYATAAEIARKARALPGISDVLIPQDMDYPSLALEVDRVRASDLGLTQKEVVGNVITAISSDQMIAPSFWVDPKTGVDYLLTVQYPEEYVKTMEDLRAIPLRAAGRTNSTRLDAVSRVSHIHSPTEVDHYQLRRVVDVFVSPEGEDLGHSLQAVRKIIAETKAPEGVRITVRGVVEGMEASFRSFGLGLLLSVLLVYLILVAQFRSFLDPLLILLAVPTGLTGALITFHLTGTTLNIMSLMGIVMMVGIVVSNSILIVEFTHRLIEDGKTLREAVSLACRVRLRPVLMTSLATLIGLLPMALKLGVGTEAYAPLALAIIGGLGVSVVLTVFIVPAAFLLVHRGRHSHDQSSATATVSGAST
ncbi:MAG: efflux RND transporter permease subunit, partial [Verrucomicrobia bacterium]|nr:efflux RND transporter permease subunit [Verrucomicrobiota bacterium]